MLRISPERRNYFLYKTAKMCPVHPSVLPILASWTPSWALYIRLYIPPWPPGRHFALYCRHWLHCPSRFGLQDALRSSKMAFGAPTWSSKPHSKFNLALLGSIFGALTTLRIELSPRRELNSHGSGIFAVQALLDCCFAALQWVSDAFWTQLGSSWESLGALLVALRPVSAALGALLAALGALLGCSSAPPGRLLAVSWARLGPAWAPRGLQVASK